MSATVYTDGACLGNPGPGGWAWACPGGAFASGAEAKSTNQRMEVMAALQAVLALPGELVVVSDSTYVVKCHTDRWYEGWERRGWKNANRQPVANQDLWRPLVELFHSRGDELGFRWVKGHSADVMNDLVDRLAVEAAQTQTGRHGSEPPTTLGPADRPTPRGPRGDGPSPPAPGSPPLAGPAEGAAPSPSGAAPSGHRPLSGHRVVVLGHRPPELGGYGDNPVAAGVRRRLTEILVGLRAVHPDLVVLTGLGLGAEQLGAEAAAAAGVPYVAVLAFPDPDAVWPAQSRAAYRRLRAAAADTVVLQATNPATKPAAGTALRTRDAWLTGQADGAVVVWDGQDRTLAEVVNALERRRPDDVWVLAPEPGR